MPKAQIAFTLIIVVAIVVAALLLFFPSTPKYGHQNAIDPSFEFVTSCLKQAGSDAIVYVGTTGGYFQPHTPGPVPSISSIEQALAIKTKDFLPACYDNFNAIRTQGIRVSAGNPRVGVTLTKARIIINLDQLIEIHQGQTIRRHRQFTTTLNVPLLEVIQVARRLQAKHPEGVDITGLVQHNWNATLFVE